jgi:hypothetical protein
MSRPRFVVNKSDSCPMARTEIDVLSTKFLIIRDLGALKGVIRSASPIGNIAGKTTLRWAARHETRDEIEMQNIPMSLQNLNVRLSWPTVYTEKVKDIETICWGRALLRSDAPILLSFRSRTSFRFFISGNVFTKKS